MHVASSSSSTSSVAMDTKARSTDTSSCVRTKSRSHSSCGHPFTTTIHLRPFRACLPLQSTPSSCRIRSPKLPLESCTSKTERRLSLVGATVQPSGSAVSSCRTECKARSCATAPCQIPFGTSSPSPAVSAPPVFGPHRACKRHGGTAGRVARSCERDKGTEMASSSPSSCSFAPALRGILDPFTPASCPAATPACPVFGSWSPHTAMRSSGRPSADAGA